jgi:glycine reductase
MRVVHYLNQFFGGLGAEEAAGAEPESRQGSVGPGMGLAKVFGDSAEIVGTVLAGDNFMAEGGQAALYRVVDLIAQLEPDVVVAGPAFGSGRYGLACAAVCLAVKDRLEVPAVTGLDPQSPGAIQYRAEVTIVPTRETAAGMGAALPEMGRLALKLASGEALGRPDEDGYLSRGLRKNVFAEKRGSTRAIDMLLAKHGGGDFVTEWPLPAYEAVPPAPPLEPNGPVRLALVTEAGMVPAGNPDGIPSGWATKWMEYSLEGLDRIEPGSFESVHGGMDTSFANADPNRQIPLDAARALEAEGRIELHPFLSTTTGNMGSIPEMQRLGAEIGDRLRRAEVQAAIVGST